MKLKFLSILFVSFLVTSSLSAQEKLINNDQLVFPNIESGFRGQASAALGNHEYRYYDGVCTIDGQEVSCEQMKNAYNDSLKNIKRDYEDSFKSFIGFTLFTLVIFLVVSFISMALFVLWIITLVHAIDKPIENKGIWIVVLILTGGLGSIFYYFLVMRPFNKANKVAPTQTQSAPEQNSTN